MSQILWTSSSILLRETILDGYLVNIEPLRIGSGREPPLGSPIDLAVLRITLKGSDVPYIPGSSLKGFFRNYATLLAKTKGLNVCTGLSNETCGETVRVHDKTLNDFIKECMESKEPAEVRKAMEAFFERACLMCKIFGSTRYMSKVFFSDAYPIDENGNLIDVRTGVRTGIAINRRTGAIFGRASYNVEYVEPEGKFRFTINCRNLPNYAIGLFSQIFERIHEGQLKIGGFKTRGFGAVRVERLRFRNRDFLGETSTVMKSLEPGVDKDVNLSGIAELKDGWLIAENDKAWLALKEFKKVWEGYGSKG